MVEQGKTPYNSTYPKDGVSCSKNSFMVNRSFVFQIKFCGKIPTLWVVAKRKEKIKKNLASNNRTVT